VVGDVVQHHDAHHEVVLPGDRGHVALFKTDAWVRVFAPCEVNHRLADIDRADRRVPLREHRRYVPCAAAQVDRRLAAAAVHQTFKPIGDKPASGLIAALITFGKFVERLGARSHALSTSTRRPRCKAHRTLMLQTGDPNCELNTVDSPLTANTAGDR
jgi:hypothetical protein